MLPETYTFQQIITQQPLIDMLSGFSPIMLVFIFLPLSSIVSYYVFRITGSFFLAMLANTGTLFYLTILGIIPLWMVFLSGIPVLLGAFNMVNYLIQDPNKQNKNQNQEQIITIDKSVKTIVPKINNTKIDLRKEFEKVQFVRGTKSYTKLNDVYTKLDEILNSGTNDSIINIDKIKKLTSEIYIQGISILKQVLQIAQQTTVINVEELNNETQDLKNELSKCEINGTMYKIVNERIEKNSKLLSIVKKNNDNVDELLSQVGLYTDSLREICLELPELVNHKAKDDYDKIMIELDTRINYAQRVKEEYEKQGI